jgi:hypothetical protein
LGSKVSFTAPWNGGTIHAEADSLGELAKIVQELRQAVKLGSTDVAKMNAEDKESQSDYPQIVGASGCSDSLRKLLGVPWGKSEPRTESELTLAMRANALHFGHGTISGLLTSMTKRGELRRLKKGSSYGYVLSREPAAADEILAKVGS